MLISHAWVDQQWRSDLIDAAGQRQESRLAVNDIIDGIGRLKSRIGNARLIVVGNVPGSGQIDTFSALTQPNVDLISGQGYERFHATDMTDERILQRGNSTRD